MAQPMTLTNSMVAHAIARMVGVALIAQHRRPVMPTHIVLVMDQQATLMQPTDVHAAVRTVSAGLTVPFHQLAAAARTAMGMPLGTQTVQMAACATAPMDSLAAAARSHHHVTLTLIAAVMVKLGTRTGLTVALAFALMVSLAVIAPHHHLVDPSHTVPVMEKQATWTQPTDASATVAMASQGTTVLFRQLAAASSIATGMPLWTRTVQMAACAIVPMDGLATAARSLRPVMPNSIAQDTAQHLTLIKPMDACAAAKAVSVGPTVPFHQLAVAARIAMGMPLWTKTVQMAACATAPMDSLATAARSLRPAMLKMTVLRTE
jgi:hypothetical protein